MCLQTNSVFQNYLSNAESAILDKQIVYTVKNDKIILQLTRLIYFLANVYP